VNSKPTLEGSHKITYRPITSEDQPDLSGMGKPQTAKPWTRATGGKVGYIHIPDMGDDGIREFIKTYYPQIRKQALIVDVRGNGGGKHFPKCSLSALRPPTFGASSMIAWTSRQRPIPDAVFLRPRKFA